MINAKTFLRQCLLAVALVGTSLGALAGPTNFHVDLNTNGLANAQFIDLFFAKADLAPPATATVSNFTGAFGAVDYFEGAVTFNGDGSVTIGNDPFSNLVDFNAVFGGTFGFDISFSSDFLNGSSTDGSTFSVSVLDAGLNPLTGAALARFDLYGSAGIARSANEQFATVTAVPEPSDMLMMLTGLGLVAFTVRRRKGPAAR